MRWKTLPRKRLQMILLMAGLICVLPAIFWQDMLVASPLFFGYRGDDLFGIYTASLDGTNFHPVLLDPKREMTHARVSPDRKHITFTRYNRVVKGGLCEETGSDYLNTEVVVADISGQHQHSIESIGPEILTANSSWVDNDSIIYIHKRDLKTLPELRIYHLSTGAISHVPTPTGLAVADPHRIGTTVVFPVIPIDDKQTCALWTMNIDGIGARQLTNPVITQTAARQGFRLGDYDPWLSPNAESVTFMRYYGGTDWRLFTADMKSGQEKQLSKSGIMSGIPKWSADGKLIVFVCWDNSKLENLGLYTMTPTGENRKKIPLPAGYMYTHPSFSWMKNGTSHHDDSARTSETSLMFSARRVPGLPK